MKNILSDNEKIEKLVTIEFILFNYLSIWNAKRDIAKLLKDNK